MPRHAAGGGGARLVASAARPNAERPPVMIDLRSDTLTRPTPAMLEAMHQARVGDDVYGEDETVNSLERKMAGLFAVDAALFCPTGTMSNQLAVRVHTQPGDEVICSELAHLYLDEGGGIACHSGASVRVLAGDRGRFTAAAVRDNVNSRDDLHVPQTRLVAVEDTVSLGGGVCWELAEIERIRAVCKQEALALHLDGARLFNALTARGEKPAQYGRTCDTLSVCLSKGLGAPVGSVLLGSAPLIARARRWRKTMGGGMRQVGYLAAAGLYALEHHVERLALDHRKAAAVAQALAPLPFVEELSPVETNIVIFRLHSTSADKEFLGRLAAAGILALAVRPHTIRLVFHLDVSEAQVERVIDVLRALH